MTTLVPTSMTPSYFHKDSHFPHFLYTVHLLQKFYLILQVTLIVSGILCQTLGLLIDLNQNFKVLSSRQRNLPQEMSSIILFPSSFTHSLGGSAQIFGVQQPHKEPGIQWGKYQILWDGRSGLRLSPPSPTWMTTVYTADEWGLKFTFLPYN